MKLLPDFLSITDIHTLHQVSLEEAGGSDGVRDPGMLASALAMPEASFDGQYLHDGIPAMAAAYLYHLVQNHPFVDANKRTALLACLTFLEINGYQSTLNEDEWIALVLGIAQSDITKDQCIERLRAHCRLIDEDATLISE